MADKLLLPGYGGAYTSESFTSSSATGADTIDCSRCRQLAIQVSSTGSPGGNLDIQTTINGSDWAAMPAPFANIAVTDGTLVLADEADGPFGKLRIDATDITAGTDETIVVTIVGFE